MVMSCQSDLNKLNRFMSVFTQWCDCVHANQDAREKRLISSSNFVVIRSEYFQFSNPRKKY